MSKTTDEVVVPIANLCRACLKNIEYGISIRDAFFVKMVKIKIYRELQRLMQMKITEQDGKPQYICTDCFERVKLTSSFRKMCEYSRDALSKICNNEDVTVHQEDVSISKPDFLSSPGDNTIIPVEEVKPSRENYKCSIIVELEESSHKTLVVVKDEEQKEITTFTCMNCSSSFANEMALLKHIASDCIHLRPENYPLKYDEKNGKTSNSKTVKNLQSDHKYVKSFNETKNSEEIINEESQPTSKLAEEVNNKRIIRPERLEEKEFIRSHLICHVCDVKFPKNFMLTTHIREFHPDANPFTCITCGKFFNTIHKLERHILTHKVDRKLQCQDCERTFSKGKDLSKHRNIMHSYGEFECKECHLKFNMRSKFNYHMKWHDPNKRHPCRFCPKAFLQQQHLKHHERVHTGERPFLCNHCGKSFRIKYDLKVHIRGVHTGERPFLCTICSKAFTQKHLLDTHMDFHRDASKYTCAHCNKQLSTKYNLLAHMRTHTKTHSYKCEECGKTFVKLSQLTNHIRSDHPEKINEIMTFYKYTCQICYESFNLEQSLLRHIEKHSENRKYSCDLCEKSFKRQEHLKLHVNVVHLKIRSHPCTMCDRTFSTSHDLKVHKYWHTGEKPSECKFCGKRFRLPSSLKTHLRIHDINDRPYTCSHCPRTFKTYVESRNHQDKHQEDLVSITPEGLSLTAEGDFIVYNNENLIIEELPKVS